MADIFISIGSHQGGKHALRPPYQIHDPFKVISDRLVGKQGVSFAHTILHGQSFGWQRIPKQIAIIMIIAYLKSCLLGWFA